MLGFRCEASVIESAVVETMRQPTSKRTPGEERSVGRPLAGGDCPSTDTILDFCAGQLVPGRSRSFRRHLELCPACMDLVTGAVNDWAQPEAADLLEVGSNFRAGEHVGPFRLVRFIARGGMGEVYEARDAESGERVALKAILASSCDQRGLLQAFQREARLGRRVSHRNVCRVHAPRPRVPGQTLPVPYFTMDYLAGETLQERLRRGPLSSAAALAISEQILLGLRAVHDAGVLHLDIKASNVMLGEDTPTTATILDFGLAREAHRTRDGRVRPLTGSLPYMPPEQILGDPPSQQNDVFAFGVVLFQMLTAELPFPMAQPSTPSSIVKRLAAHAQPPSSLAPDVPPWLDGLVSSCLSEPERRPRDASEVLAALAAH
jgi:serine/threonine protein kinase